MRLQYDDACLLIFAKAPVPGRVKTRLIPALGEDGACELYKSMLLEIVEKFASSRLCPVYLLCQPDIEHKVFKEIAAAQSLTCYTQQGEDLGERMSHAATYFLQGVAKVIIIGTDCPEYSMEYIKSAIHALDDHDVVLGPATDGGYVLIGLKDSETVIFSQIDWGQNTVLAKTIKNIKNNNLTYQLLSPLHDIDLAEDLIYLK